MEVIKDCAALLSNHEVLSVLESLKSELKAPKYSARTNEMKQQLSEKEKGLQRLNTIVYETVKYLEEMPCVTQTPEAIKNFLTAIAPYSLTKAEKLQLLNIRPTSLVEIQLGPARKSVISGKASYGSIGKKWKTLSASKIEKYALLIIQKLHKLIEESEERFNEDQMNEILAVVASTLPPGPKSDSKPPSEADYEENG